MGFTHEVKKIDRIEYALHHKEGAPDSVKVTYVCGLNVFREWVCIEHRGYAQQKAWEWWQERMPGGAFPATSEHALEILQSCSLKVPSKLKVKLGGKFPEIERFFYEEKTNDNSTRVTGVKNHADSFYQRNQAYGGAAAAY
jgi:DNA repair protein RadD